MLFSTAISAWEIEIIAHNITFFCMLPSLMSLAALNVSFQLLILLYVQCCLTRVLTPFICNRSKYFLFFSLEDCWSCIIATLPSFWSALCADGGVIFTSMALKTMMEDCDAGWKPGTLNIVVPVKRGQFISELFLGKILKPTIVLRRNEWLECTWTRSWCLSKGPAHVKVTEIWDESVLPVVLSAQSTMHMIAISLRHIYCFYPDTTIWCQSIRGPPATF